MKPSENKNFPMGRKKITIKKDTSPVLPVFLILLYSAINIALLLHHEPWEDEAHTWLVARDLDIISIFKQMAYDGTPALWYILNVPFAKTGGLADVSSSLPKALAELGCEVKLFLPKYSYIDENKFNLHYNWNVGEMLIRISGHLRSVHLHQTA